MNRVSLKATEREIIGKKVKKLRSEGFVPGHVFGKGTESESVSVNNKDFLNAFAIAGMTGLIDLKIGEEKVRPVLVRDVQYHALSGQLLNIDFHQVNLKEKVKVLVPIVIKETDTEIESVKMGEAIVIQPLTDVEIEALPTDLIEHLEVDISTLKNIDDAVTLGSLIYDREKITVLGESEEVVVKLAPAITEEMKKLMEEQEAEAAAAQEAVAEESTEEKAEGEEGEVSEEEGGEAGETDKEAETPSVETEEESK